MIAVQNYCFNPNGNLVKVANLKITLSHLMQYRQTIPI